MIVPLQISHSNSTFKKSTDMEKKPSSKGKQVISQSMNANDAHNTPIESNSKKSILHCDFSFVSEALVHFDKLQLILER